MPVRLIAAFLAVVWLCLAGGGVTALVLARGQVEPDALGTWPLLCAAVLAVLLALGAAGIAALLGADDRLRTRFAAAGAGLAGVLLLGQVVLLYQS